MGFEFGSSERLFSQVVRSSSAHQMINNGDIISAYQKMYHLTSNAVCLNVSIIGALTRIQSFTTQKNGNEDPARPHVSNCFTSTPNEILQRMLYRIPDDRPQILTLIPSSSFTSLCRSQQWSRHQNIPYLFVVEGQRLIGLPLDSDESFKRAFRYAIEINVIFAHYISDDSIQGSRESRLYQWSDPEYREVWRLAGECGTSP
jgi:hypothetical protein